MTYPRFRRLSLTLAFTVFCFSSVSSPAHAGPDLDGAVKALAAVPADGIGDAVGGAGLVAASVLGFGANLVAAIDNNSHSHVILRGLVSTPLRRLALGMSRTSSGILEGFSNDDYEYYPQDESVYLKANLQKRFWTLRGGLGAMVLSVVDTLGNTGQFLLRLPGAGEAADSLARIQTDARTRLVGPAKDGAYDVGTYDFGRN